MSDRAENHQVADRENGIGTLSEVQTMLLEMLRRFLADCYDDAERRKTLASDAGWSPSLWEEMAELGLLAAPLPEAHGGIGRGCLPLIMEEFGRKLVLEPYLSAIVIGGALFDELDDQVALAQIAAGELRIAFAHDEAPHVHGTSGIKASAKSEGGGYALSGSKIMVIDAPIATHLVVSANLESGQLGLFLVPADDPAIIREDCRMIDGRPAANILLNGVLVKAKALLSKGNEALILVDKVGDQATLAVCYEALGIMREVLDQTLAYTRQRKQFGAALTSFQVIQHRLADMLVDIEQSASIALRASFAIADREAVSAAKVRVNAALKRVAQSAVQLHGGIGTTDELPLSQYFRRAATIERQFGTTAQHMQRIDQALSVSLAAPKSSDVQPFFLIESHADNAFREEVRAFLAESFPSDLRRRADRQAGVYADAELAAEWQGILYEKGWVAPSWPEKYGGTGWTPRQRLIFEQECAFANTPVLPAMGLQMCGPVLIGHGTEEQKSRFLPRILTGEDRWCQGYSEPEAGSDLASLRCRMTRDGDHYVINGTKIWTTGAHTANWMFLLGRTDPDAKPQAGITFILVPMETPGISVTPILSMSGEHEVNQVFFDDVRVEVANRIGPENQGWTVAKYLLEFERGGAAATARALRVVGLIRRLAAENGGFDHELADRLAKLDIEIASTDWTQQRMLANIEAGGSVGNANASILKLKASELYQEASMLFLDALGSWGLVDQRAALDGNDLIIGPEIGVTGAARYMNSRAMSIFGGSSEVQKTILAKQMLGK
jgi:alkylation response protein AidB-like acyl-CoA dehydrogenase